LLSKRTFFNVDASSESSLGSEGSVRFFEVEKEIAGRVEWLSEEVWRG
jgi:hypothetical protein